MKPKSEQRIKANAEVFTPPLLVNQMLSKLPKEVWKFGKSFCDPSCGNGNFLIHVLWRKLSRNHNPLLALQSIFGADIMQDSIRECRLRLLKIVSIFTPITKEYIKTVFQNIVWINPKKHPGGSLDYDFAFNNKIKQRDIDRWMEWITHENALDTVSLEDHLPVAEEEFGKMRDIFEKGDE